MSPEPNADVVEHSQVVIIGAGQAGVQFADSLREAGHQGAVTILEQEDVLPYQRPPLSKDHLSEGAVPGAVPLRAVDFYPQKDIVLRGGAQALAVDRANQRVALSDGTTVSYTTLVFATGAANRVLTVRGSDLAGVHGLRTQRDADRVRDELSRAHSVVVVGAGFVGLEFAAAARARGADVTVLEAAGRALGRAASEQISAHVAAAHRRMGTDLRLSESVQSLDGSAGRVEAVTSTAGRRYPADLVLVGIGAVPRDQLAADAGIAVDNGIIVDEALRTSDPNIYAIGDCARFPSVHAGGPVRLESVQNAADHGRHLALSIMNGPGPYTVLPWFWSHQGPLRLQIAGLIGDGDDRVICGDSASEKFSVLSYRDGQLVAVESINSSADHLAARKLLRAGRSPSAEDASVEGFSLREFARSTAAGTH
jgi:3-phenylpropionate/trans-cinnamate dioxygenase ferredoxin reductase subunit